MRSVTNLHRHICPRDCAVFECHVSKRGLGGCSGRDGSARLCEPCFQERPASKWTPADYQIALRNFSVYFPRLEAALRGEGPDSLEAIQAEIRSNQVRERGRREP